MIESINILNNYPVSLPYIDGPGVANLELGSGVSLGNGVETRANRLIPKDNAEARQQLAKAGQQFEAYFISYLLKVMRETVPEGSIANKHGAYFHSFYDQEIGVRAAESGGIGIAKMVREYAEKQFPQPPVEASSSIR